MKRTIDLLLSSVGLVLLSPVLVVLIPLVRLSSPGPAIFSQVRVGKGKKPFVCYKLRTMTVGTREVGTHEVSAASVTSIGRFLRKSKLDEIPQLWNVVRGEMSLVGPRPCLPVQEELIKEREDRGVYEIMPGITGLGQVRGIDMSVPLALAECDAEYLEKQSLGFDFKLLMQTVFGAGREDRVKTA